VITGYSVFDGDGYIVMEPDLLLYVRVLYLLRNQILIFQLLDFFSAPYSFLFKATVVVLNFNFSFRRSARSYNTVLSYGLMAASLRSDVTAAGIRPKACHSPGNR